MTAAIYFHPEGYTTKGPKLMGRHAAGESFLRGYLSYGAPGDLWIQVESRNHARFFAEAARALGRKEAIRVVNKENLPRLREPGVVYYPGPGIGQYAWQRAYFGHGSWSLCGVTHTTSSEGAMDQLANLLTAPVQPWDAVICTSRAVKDNVDRLLDAQYRHLEQRLGARRQVLPLLPVIPLGIHCEGFVYSPAEKAVARKRIGADSKTHVVMFMGRLAFHAKAHPLAMYQALEKAAASLPAGEKILLAECGWHPNESMEKAYAEAAKLAAPHVRVVQLDGRSAEDRKTAWASADVFCSLSDNIQETFGIVPIEAMAAGLPVVVSDWDGYRDTVRDGVDGFRIPTLMPGAGLGRDLAIRHALGVDSYDMYCGHSCSLIAVDVEATAIAFSRLFSSPELRLRMGDEGRKRAREVYDWRVIMGQYEGLWARQQEVRRAQQGKTRALRHPWPARLDPFHSFAAYPTETLDENTNLALCDDLGSARARAGQYRQLVMVKFAGYVVPSQETVEHILLRAASGTTPARLLIEGLDGKDRVSQLRGLSWLVKMGILRLVK